jgi:type II secretory pathway pseudopilin PulG
MELVISILVLGILGATAAYGIQNGVMAFQATQEALDSLGKLRYATERVSRELREIRRDPLDSSRYDIATLGGSTIEFVKQDGTEVTLDGQRQQPDPGIRQPRRGPCPHRPAERLQPGLPGRRRQCTADAAQVAFIDVQITLSDASGSLPQRSRVALRSQP